MFVLQLKKISSPLERNLYCSSYTFDVCHYGDCSNVANALRIHIKIMHVKIFVCEISLRLRDFLCSLRWIPIYSVVEDNMTSTSCLYFSRRITVMYCTHCFMLQLSLWYQFIWPPITTHSVIAMPVSDSEGLRWGNVMVLPSCCCVVMEIVHLKFQGPPSLLLPGFLLAAL